MRYLIHIYRVGITTSRSFNDKSEALATARALFNSDDTYKVKVFDTYIGDPEPNKTDSSQLLLVLN